MKLDMDCARDILLAMEKHEFYEHIDMATIIADVGVSKYNELTIEYACVKLIEAEYLTGRLRRIYDTNFPRVVRVMDITTSGHEFLDKIRKPSTWDKTKEIGSKAGTLGFSMVSRIAEGVATAYINTLLGSGI